MKPIIYIQHTGYVIIEWYEKKEKSSPIHRYFSAQPVRLQLHPKDEQEIIRCYFNGSMPVWMKKFAKEYRYQCEQVTAENETGWWIANWNSYPDGFKPFSAPKIDGALRQFSNSIPDVCEDAKKRAIDNLDVIKRNLQHYPDAFESFGLHYRAEEITGEGGALLIEDIIPTRKPEETDSEYKGRIEVDQRLDQLIYEITTPLPEPVLMKEESQEVESEELQSELSPLEGKELNHDSEEDVFDEEEMVIEEGEIFLSDEPIFLEEDSFVVDEDAEAEEVLIEVNQEESREMSDDEITEAITSSSVMVSSSQEEGTENKEDKAEQISDNAAEQKTIKPRVEKQIAPVVLDNGQCALW
ncbi:hypothetical protein AM501_05365 [Aneurinibacillus migulanus]|uniref:hypothetical protein n=1 Tax=Aneurinibacillus migulanus TaxID=47500 RepID=UPI0006B48160|nr:hypothetical protein [Aneurinibacillus migulanus]KPD09264.1 hypothetical protein AM501_05365 [Aneurinibacillus migulanus]